MFIRKIQTAFLGLLLPALLISPVVAFAQNDTKRNEGRNEREKSEVSSRSRAIIAADFDSGWCRYLPPGIAKRFSSCNGGNPSDTTAPVISNIRIDRISDTSARIRLDTNEATRARVSYSLHSGFAINGSDVITSDERGYDFKHDFMIRNLAPGTTYYVLIRASDRSGNVAVSSQQTFATLPVDRDITAPLVGNIVIQGVTDTTATITWQTNEPSTTVAWYRSEPLVARLFSGQGGKEAGSDSKVLTTNHSITLTELSPGTNYVMTVGGRDASGNMGSSSEQRFTTQKSNDTTAPLIYNVSVQTNGSNKTATVSWLTNEASDSQVFYGTTTNVHATGSLAVKDPAFSERHELTLINLQTGVMYYFEIQSTDQQGNKQTSPLYTLLLK